MNFSVETDGINSTLARLRVNQAGITKFAIEAVEKTVERGYEEAQRGVPRGPARRNRQGERMADAIRYTHAEYAPGGLGGGGTRQAALYISFVASPHARFVMEGTGEGGLRKILARDVSKRGFFWIDKEGEKPHAIKEFRGQRPQIEWWERSKLAMQEELEARIADFDIQNT
jgi:hypothetical protein